MTVLSKPAYVCDYSGKMCVYMWLWKLNPCTWRKKKKNKANKQDETNFTPSGPYWENMPPNLTQKEKNQSNSSTFNTKNPKKKQLGTSLVWSPILLWRETSYGFGCTIIDSYTWETNPFPICKKNQTSNTKGPQIIPYSGRLK